jgi:hypothetical protein
MANSIEKASLFQQMLDEQMIQEMTSTWMEANASMVRYNGGNTVKIPKLSTSGLGDYDRASGYTSGSVTLEFETHTFSQDRGQSFTLDSMDVDESNFTATAGNTLAQFQRTKVVPEVDAYRYSTVFDYANLGGKVGSYTPVAATVLSQLRSDIASVQDVVGESEPLVIAMTYGAANILDNSSELSKDLRVDEFQATMDGNGQPVVMKVRYLDDVPIVRVPSARMKTLYDFSATDGFSADANALDINWIIMSRRAVIAVVKQDKVRIFDPNTNQSADGWKIDYRKYHDVWVPDNKVVGIYASYVAEAAPALTATVAGGSAGGTTSFTATAGAGNSLAYVLTAAADTRTDLSYGIVPDSGLTAYTSGDDIAATAGQFLNMVELDSEGKVVKVKIEELEAGDIT